MRGDRVASVLLLAMFASLARAQEPQPRPRSPEPMSRVLQRHWEVSSLILRGAEAMPENKYAFRPAADALSFAEEIGHVADGHYQYCSRVRSEPNPAPARIEGAVVDKRQLVARLKESIAYCETVFASVTDAALSEFWQQGAVRNVKLGPLVGVIAHDNEHYTPVILMLRMNGVKLP